jgi:preprotein translocase subunit SecE
MAVTARKRTEPTAEGGIVRFLREVFDELRKVVWPTWGELYPTDGSRENGSGGA